MEKQYTKAELVALDNEQLLAALNFATGVNRQNIQDEVQQRLERKAN